MSSPRNKKVDVKVQAKARAIRLRLKSDGNIPPEILKTLRVKVRRSRGGFSYEVSSSWVNFSGWCRAKDAQGLRERLRREAIRVWKADWY